MSFRGGTRSAIAVAVLIVVSCVSLATACTRDETEVEPAPSPTSTPPFATEEEALEAARATYEGFLRSAEAVMADGGDSPERVDEWATLEVAAPEKITFADMAAAGERITGETVLDNVVLQEYRPDRSDGVRVVTAYFCVDVENVDVINESGASVVLPDRPDKTAFEASFDLSETHSTQLRISSKVVWAGEGVC